VNPAATLPPPRPSRSRSFAFIALFALALVAAGWAAVLYLLAFDHEAELERVRNENSFIASTLEEYTRRVLGTADSALLFMKSRFESAQSVTDGIREFGTIAKEDLKAVQIAITDAEGNLIYAAVPISRPINISANETFRVHRDNPDRGLFVGVPYTTQTNGKWAFFLTRRLNHPDGSFAGIVSVGIDPFYFGNLYGNLQVGIERSGLIVGTDHIVRVRISPNVKIVGDDIGSYSPVFRMATDSPTGDYELIPSLDKKLRMASYRVLPDYPLIVIVSARKGEAMALHYERKNAYILSGILFMLFVALASCILLRAQWRTESSHHALTVELAERRRTEAALKESQELFTEFMDHMPAMVGLMDAEGGVLLHNVAVREFFGTNLHGKSFRNNPATGPAEDDSLQALMAKALSEGSANDLLPVSNSRREERVLDTSIFQVIRPDDPPLLGLIALDVTERQREEERQAELERKMWDAQKAESLGLLAGGIAHDFNNLLHGIVGNVDLALDGLPEESAATLPLKRAEAAAQRATELTNQMLAYSGRSRFVIEHVDLSALVAEMGSLLSSAGPKAVKVEYDLAEGLPPLEADATQLRQVVMNLLTNAADSYGGEPGTVRISTGVEKPKGPGERASVFFEVADEGCGMDEATLEKIYEPFFSTKKTGRGLGLAAVQGIVRGHGGRIELTSRMGRGTTFRVFFPAADAPEQEKAPPPPKIAASAAGGVVLFADDEEAVRDTVGPMLETLGYQVVAAADGVEAVDRFRAEPGRFDVVILDMTMPRMGGLEAFEEIWRTTPGIPVILTSGYSQDEFIHRHKDKPIACFLQKPYRLSALASCIEDSIRSET